MDTARLNLERIENYLRNHRGNLFIPANVFKTRIGRFWYMRGTQKYMRARFALVDALRVHFPTHRDAVQVSLNHVLDIMRLALATSCISDTSWLLFSFTLAVIRKHTTLSSGGTRVASWIRSGKGLVCIIRAMISSRTQRGLTDGGAWTCPMRLP